MFCVRPGKDQDHLRLKEHILAIALTGMTSLPIPSAGIKPILSVFLAAVVSGRKAMLVYAKRVTRAKSISDNVTNSFIGASRRVQFPVDPSLPSFTLARNDAQSQLIHATRGTRKLHKSHHRVHTQQSQTTNNPITRSFQAVASQ
jgi:hypothetical protein